MALGENIKQLLTEELGPLKVKKGDEEVTFRSMQEVKCYREMCKEDELEAALAEDPCACVHDCDIVSDDSCCNHVNGGCVGC